MKQEVILDVRGVSKKFKRNSNKSDNFKSALGSLFSSAKNDKSSFEVLSDITLQVKRGEVLGIIGRNGAGKSTLLKILSGILQPDSGEIDFYGKSASILDIGAGFHPDLTGRENVYLSASLHGFSRKETETRFDEIVEFSGIGKFIDEPVKNYSAGMYLRLAFSIIAHIDADVFIFDEVLAVGDASFQLKSRKKFEEIIQQGRSVVMVSHNLGEVAKFADRVIYLESGKIQNTGDAGDVIETYVQEAVKTEYPVLDKQGQLSQVIYGKPNEGLGFFSDLRIAASKTNEGALPFYSSDSIKVEISLSKKTKRGIVPGLFVSDINDGIALTTSTLNATDHVSDIGLDGEVTYMVEFPSYYFNNSIVVFSFFFVVLDEHNEYAAAERVAISQKLMIKVEEDMPEMAGIKRMPGVIRPKLKWKIGSK